MSLEREQPSSWVAELLALAIEETEQLQLPPPIVDELLDRNFWINGNEAVN